MSDAPVILHFPDSWGGTVNAIIDGESNNQPAQGEVTIPRGAPVMIQLFHPAPETLAGLPSELGEQPFAKALHALGGSDETLRAVAGLDWIKTLNVVGVVSDWEAERFTGIFEQTVAPGGELLTDAALGDVVGRDDLVSVYLGGTVISDAGLAQLARMANLADLGVRSSELDGSGLADLPANSKLATISLTGEQVNWNSLPSLPNVTSITLAGPRALEGLNEQTAARYPSLTTVSVFLDDQVTHPMGEDLWTLRDAFPGVEVNGQTFTAKALAKLRAKRGGA